MSIPDSVPNDRGILWLVLCAPALILACTSAGPCDLPEPNSAPLLHAVRSSGGIVLESAEFRVEPDRLVYVRDGARCAKLSPQESEEIRAWLDSLTEFSGQIPTLPGETFSRGMIYQDHD